MSPLSFPAAYNPVQNKFLHVNHTYHVTTHSKNWKCCRAFHQLGSATWTGGISRRLKEAGGPNISISGELWPLLRPANINIGITVSFFSSIFFLCHSWTISQLCCAWKQNVSSHPVQHQADCLHKARQVPLHRSPSTSLRIPVMLVYLLTQLQTPISHHFGSWKIILWQSGAGVSMWVHFSEWKIIIFNYMK